MRNALGVIRPVRVSMESITFAVEAETSTG
jgi:hypothetical protein